MSVEELVLQLPRLEKLRLMETLWSDLNRGGDELDSPEWHETALRETEKRVVSGQEQVLDWEDAKRRIRMAR